MINEDQHIEFKSGFNDDVIERKSNRVLFYFETICTFVAK